MRAKRVARPHKHLDAAALERWAERFAPHQFTAWEYSDACECFDFWDWLDLNHPGVFEEFENWFRRKDEVVMDVEDSS